MCDVFSRESLKTYQKHKIKLMSISKIRQHILYVCYFKTDKKMCCTIYIYYCTYVYNMVIRMIILQRRKIRYTLEIIAGSMN